MIITKKMNRAKKKEPVEKRVENAEKINEAIYQNVEY